MGKINRRNQKREGHKKALTQSIAQSVIRASVFVFYASVFFIYLDFAYFVATSSIKVDTRNDDEGAMFADNHGGEQMPAARRFLYRYWSPPPRYVNTNGIPVAEVLGWQRDEEGNVVRVPSPPPPPPRFYYISYDDYAEHLAEIDRGADVVRAYEENK